MRRQSLPVQALQELQELKPTHQTVKQPSRGSVICTVSLSVAQSLVSVYSQSVHVCRS